MFDIETINSILSALSSMEADQDGKFIWRITDLLQGIAGFTFVSLFLVDASREFVVMKAGSGWAGKRMVERGHRCRAYPRADIKVNPIGLAVYFDRVQILDYSSSMASPDIGDSCWRLAFPLRVNDQAVGALSVDGAERISFKIEEMLGFQKVADEVSKLLVKHNLI